ncbi:RNA-binding region-containing protein 3 [Parasteatoda tepidariorum]|uniref:RNA-binding region-containing protein 3 n=1 Tax=Parasteatoda tepidariorum TaxID=114398 RepID=UPI00077FBE96|nr:RNA-binding region-containing protein 3 [Parasteatoda tepidariorum]
MHLFSEFSKDMLESSTLFIKHFPAELSPNDREELLQLVGAIKVRVMPDKGRMKYTAFATFKDHGDAKHALSLLHQRKILDRTLTVEFSKHHHEDFIPQIGELPNVQKLSKEGPVKSSEKENLRLEMEDFSKQLHGVAPSLGLDYLPSPLLKYKYPAPTPTIIQNISHALASVPKFYTQVLHLMNKMNLPAPFGPLTPAPPLAPDLSKVPGGEDSLTVENMEVTSSEESEYESEKEEGYVKQEEKIIPENQVLKKPKKKRKAKLNLPSLPNQSAKRQRTEPSEVFDSQPLSQKKINMKNIEQIIPVDPVTSIEPTGGFGEIEPAKESNEGENEESEPTEETWYNSKCITIEELKKKRMSSREMKTLSIFRNYSPGEPSCRLYIKNLAKQVNEKDLRYIFGRFIDRTSENDRNMFDIKLMKEGRMKGQAFISLANEVQAKEAVRETNGFILHTKPLVVQFARSAKPKEDKKEIKNEPKL